MQEAINAYYAVTEIEMPVAGNVYAFIGKGYTSASDCYLWNNNGVLSIASYSEGTTELPESAYFSCEVVDGQYMFKTVDGQYYMAFPSPGKNWLYNKSENGLEASASNLTKFDILKIVQTTRVQKATSDMFGQVYMWGCRGNGDSADGDLRYGSMIVKSGAWDGAGEPYCDSTPQSSAFSIVKVDYNVTPVYTVSVKSTVGGTAEASATEAEEGTEVTFTATAEEGYAFVSWTAGTDTVSVENPYTTVVNANVELTANFELLPVKYTVTVNAGVGGTAEASATEVEEGTEVTLTATAAEGYAFAGWTTPETTPLYYIQNYNTKKYLGYNSSNLAAIDEQTSDVTIAPSTMNEGEFTFFLTNATYDQQTPPQAQSYLHCGSSGRFSGNSVNTSASQQIAVFKVEDPAAETITATQVTEITSGATYMFVGLKNGVYFALTDELYKEGTTDQRMVGAEVTITDGTISFVPGTSSALWTITNKAFESTENPYTVTVTANAEFTANFVEVPVVKYAVSVTTVDATMGTAEVSATEVKEGEEATFTATANLGYKFIGWLSNGETVSTENPYTTAVTAEMALVANFEALVPAIVLTVDKVDQEWQFNINANADDSKEIKVDWGNGALVDYTIENYNTSSVYPYHTTITGTPVGEGVVKIYAGEGNLYKFDCSYAESYGVKVTSLDLSGVNYLKELNVASNSLTTLDVSQVTGMNKVVCQGNPITSLVINTSLTRIEANDCALTSIDFTGATAITYLAVNNNPMNTLDLSALTALKSLYANNTGLTSIDLSLNTKLRDVYVNENQLTTLDVSKVVSGAYVYAKDNNLTEIVGLEALTAGSRLHITGNNFTLATLPAATILTTEGESGKYCYAPQKPLAIATEINEGEELDLSAQTNIVGRASEAQATVYTWYTADGTEFTSYTETDGKFVFDVTEDTELYCTMTTAAFPSFSGANAFKTTNIVVKALVPTIVLTVDKVDQEWQFNINANADDSKEIKVDWGNGALVDYTIENYNTSSVYPYHTTITGTPVGEGVVKIYAGEGNLYKFDCSYAESYGVKVTSLDLSGVNYLKELNVASNSLTTLDVSQVTGMNKVVCQGNPITSLVINTSLTRIEANDCALTSIDFTGATAITYLAVNNNPMNTLDLSALTALKSLYANNTGLTSIDLSLNTKLRDVYVNENQLTTLDVSKVVSGAYVYAKDNNLTEIVGLEALTAGSRLHITGNNFTLATLPAATILTTEGESGKYCYAPQKPLAIAAEINEGEELDLSAQNNIVGRATEAQATVYTWYTADGTEFTNYTVEGGKFVFNVTEDTELYCAMTTEAFPSFSGTNAFTTTNIVVKYVPVERKVQFKSSNITMGTVQIISPSQGGTGTGGTGTGGTGTSGTGTSGTGTGSATSGGGQSPWVITTEDVTAQASVQGNAYEFVNWTIGEEIVGTELTYTYTGEEEALIQANFRQKETFKTITIDVKPVVKDEFGTNLVGSVNFQGRSGKTAIIEQGSSLTAVATAKDGYEFSSWKDASTGEDISFDAEYTFTVAADINLEAWFSELPVITTCQVLVQVAPTEDYGTVVIEGVEGLLAEVEVGTEVTAVATPAEGKVFDGWYNYMGDVLSTDASYTFTATEDIVVVAWFADAPVVEPEYCTDFGTSTRNGGGRSLTSVTLSDGVNGGTVSVNQSSSYGAAIYIDKTDVEISLEAGKEITADVNFAGEWMNSYLFVDWNNDAEFTANLNNFIPAEDSELLSFSFWTGENGSPSTNGVSDSYGYNSLGESVTENARSNWDLPVFTIPANIAEGTYRARVKIDWNNANPCGITSTSDAPCVVDFMLTITAPDGIEDADADAVQVYAADGVIYINGYEGNVKVVNIAGQVVKDVNVNGNDKLEMAAGLYMVVTGDQVTKVVVK